MEKCREYQIPLCIGFIDYKKAFGSVETAAVLNALREFGFEEKYAKIVGEISEECHAETDFFGEPCRREIKKGVRQGDTTSPKLFVAILGFLFRLFKQGSGIKIDGENLTHLFFADDCVLLAEIADELGRMMSEFQRESKKMGLEMNASKTKWMPNESVKESPILIEDKEIEEVTEYVYLGQVK